MCGLPSVWKRVGDVSRPFGTNFISVGSPNVETLGYGRTSLREMWTGRRLHTFFLCCVAGFSMAAGAEEREEAPRPWKLVWHDGEGVVEVEKPGSGLRFAALYKRTGGHEREVRAGLWKG